MLHNLLRRMRFREMQMPIPLTTKRSLCYIVPPVFTNSDKGKYKGAGHPVDVRFAPTGSQRPVDVGSEPTVVERRAAAKTKEII